MATSTKRVRRLWDMYAFPSFRPRPTVRGVFSDPKARVITLDGATIRGLLPSWEAVTPKQQTVAEWFAAPRRRRKW